MSLPETEKIKSILREVVDALRLAQLIKPINFRLIEKTSKISDEDDGFFSGVGNEEKDICPEARELRKKACYCLVELIDGVSCPEDLYRLLNQFGFRSVNMFVLEDAYKDRKRWKDLKYIIFTDVIIKINKRAMIKAA